MAQFQYTAVNSSGKKLSGVIGAASEDDARKQLNTFGISILEIKKTAETGDKSPSQEPATSSELPKYEFEAIDKNGRKVLGTIPASNRYKAFKRLRDEYEFEVSYVVDFGATAEQKAQARREDFSILKAQYGDKDEAEAKPESEEEAVNPEFEAKRQALLKKVDFILEKIKKMLADFNDQIRPENRKIIQDYIDKLLRIKSSTNLDYIEHTSEELLKKVQDQELFLHKENMKSQQAKVKLQSQQLMAELHSGSTPQKVMADDIETIHQKLMRTESRFLKGLAQHLEPFLETPEEKELRQRISGVNKQVWTFRKLWLTSPKEAKAEAKEGLNRILEERDRLKQELKGLKLKRRKQRIALAQKMDAGPKELNEPLITEEINSLLGWLLGFYLLAYFLSHYVFSKVFPGGNPLPGDFNLLDSNTLRLLLLSVFLWYILLSLRIEYLRYKNWANAFLIPLGLVLNATLVFNL